MLWSESFQALGCKVPITRAPMLSLQTAECTTIVHSLHFILIVAGSGRSFTAYVFNRVDPPAALPVPLAAEQPVAEGVATPDHSLDLQAACSLASSASFPGEEAGGEFQEAAAPDAALAASGRVSSPQPPARGPREGEQVQQPAALGRGTRRAVSRRGEAKPALAADGGASGATKGPRMQTRSSRGNASRAPTADVGLDGAEVQAHCVSGGALASTNTSSAAPKQQKRASPQKPKGVQKRQSPRKAAAMLLQGKTVRLGVRPGLLASCCFALSS